MLRYSASIDDLDYRVTASHREDDGFGDVNDGKSLSGVSMRAVYDVTPNDSVDVQMGLTQGPVGAWGQSPLTSPDRDKDTRSYFIYSRWRHAVSAMSEIHVQAYTNYLDWSDIYQIGPLSALFGVDPALIPFFFGQPDQKLSISRYDGTARRDDVEIQHTLAPGEDWRLVWGASFRIDTLESFQILGTSEPRSDYIRRLFANAEWTASDSLTVNAGAMIEDNGIIGTHVSPRLAANYELFANHTLRAVATRALRSPSIYENYEFNAVRFGDGTVLDIQFVSDQDIEAESIESYEIGYRGIFPQSRFEVDFKIFQEYMDDIITHPRDLTYPDAISPFLPPGQAAGSFVRVNDGYTDTSGAEIQLIYHPGRNSLVTLQYAYADAAGRIIRQIEGSQPVRYDERINNAVPTHTFSMLSSHAFDSGFQASMAFFFLSDLDWGGDGNYLPSYRRWDAKLAKKFRLGNLESNISVLVQNFLNEAYAEFQEENIFDRRTYLQLSVRM
ncbi:MAG: TonB-dependent receptor [Gammaproteobacteria bacterium]|nr:TonB-dependent receptor [Gammaproteobacteria bacterium]